MEEKLNQLTKELYRAKKAESMAKIVRIETEEAIAELVETAANGSKTVDAGDGMKVTVKRGISYKADIDGMADVQGVAIDALPIKTVVKQSLDEKAYEAMREKNPQLFTQVSKFVTTRPKKVSVTIKLT